MKKALYEVIDGTKRKPCGFVGYARTADEAKMLRSKQCRMGGYVRRILVASDEIREKLLSKKGDKGEHVVILTRDTTHYILASLASHV